MYTFESTLPEENRESLLVMLAAVYRRMLTIAGNYILLRRGEFHSAFHSLVTLIDPYLAFR